MPKANENTFSSSGIDERLLAGKWRQEKQGARQEKDLPKKKQERENTDIRQKKLQARQKEGLKKKTKDKVEQVAFAPARQFTNWLLRLSILDMLFTLGIGSFGASVLYVHLHLFARAIGFGSLFSKLGNEWVPKKIIAAGGNSAADQMGAKLFWGEVALIVIVDLIWLAVILLGVTFLVILTNAWGVFWNITFGWIGDAFSSFFN